MKTYCSISFAFLWLAVSTGFVWGAPTDVAQQAAALTKEVSTPITYSVVNRDANSRVVEWTVNEQLPLGKSVPTKHSYTEMATGMHYQKNGQWVESKELIDILPDGTAQAVQGQHRAYFPRNIYQGQIELVTPDGQHLRSRPLGLSYYDGEKSVLIAELTNSIGVVVGENRVIYPNAFTDFKVDLRYTYTKAGFEQDIIMRQQPPTPESLGLNPNTARLEILTEFFSPPQPTIKATKLAPQADLSLVDESLGFGKMQMVPGRAFSTGEDALDSGACVSKQWELMDGRQFLVEAVPVDAILEGLAKLPRMAMQTGSGQYFRTASKSMVLPPQRLAKNDMSKSVMLAQAESQDKGFVVDYQTVNSSVTNYTFRGDITYYVSGNLALFGTNNIFEGGAVIKYATNTSISASYQLIFKTGAYRPVVFTAKDDNSLGETLSGSTGSPSGYYANPALALYGSWPMSGIRILYAQKAISSSYGTLTLSDAQIVNCSWGLWMVYASINVNNALFSNVKTNFSVSFGSAYANHVTTENSTSLLTGIYDSLYMTNCVMANVGTNVAGSLDGSCNGFYQAPVFGINTFTNIFYPFQRVGAGGCYLTNGCNFLNAGTTNVNGTVLADIRTKTTYPPIVCSNTIVSNNMTLSPQVQRDTDRPDLGYHYDPIDYFVDYFKITNAILTVTNGAVIASDNAGAGIWLQDGSSIISVGTPLAPNWFVRYSTVQEQPVSLGDSLPAYAATINPYHESVLEPTGIYSFTKFSCLAGGGFHLYHSQNFWCYTNLLVQNCEFFGGENDLGGYSGTVATLKNNLFARCVFNASNGAGSYLFVTNNLFWGCSLVTFRPAGSAGWSAVNNAFDSCDSVGSGIGSLANADYNAYANCIGKLLSPTNATDIFLTNALAYQAGSLGNFYQPTNSPLINMGSINANLVGLYHFTTQTNQIKEANSTVDIGYHYLAMDGNGKPIDTDGDGIPDYLEDSNGNGLVDNGETAWMPPPVIGSQPVSQMVIQGSNAVFSVTAAGTGPLRYQWWFNGTNIMTGATNSTLTLTNVQPANAGIYFVVITNAGGNLSSGNASLTVMSWTVDSDYDGVSDAQEFLNGTDANDPSSVSQIRLGYWPFDKTNTWAGSASQLPIVATNVVGVPSWNTNAVLVDSPNPAILTYRDVELNGNANLNLRCGTVRFWFSPDWSSASVGGSGPGCYGGLIELGNNTPFFTTNSWVANSTNGWWGLYFSPDGSQLAFRSSTNGFDGVNLAVPISWASNEWHQIVLTYTPSNSTLYMDGQLVANGAGSINYPNAAERAAGFCIGSDSSGSSQASGTFEELESFNYPLDATNIYWVSIQPEEGQPIGGGQTPVPTYGPPVIVNLPSLTLFGGGGTPEPIAIDETLNLPITILATQGVYTKQESINGKYVRTVTYSPQLRTDSTWDSISQASGLSVAHGQNIITSTQQKQLDIFNISYVPTLAENELVMLYPCGRSSDTFSPVYLQYSSTAILIHIPVSVYLPKRLGHWQFNNTSLADDGEQLPLVANNCVLATSPFGGGINFDSPSATELKYQYFQNDAHSVTNPDGSISSFWGTPNFRWNRGTVRFWFKPNWSSGSGPVSSPFLKILAPGAVCNWSLLIADQGTTMQLNTSIGSSSSSSLTAPVNFVAGHWYQITATYSPSKVILYVNGQQVGSIGVGVITVTDGSKLSSFQVGSDGGNNQVRGVMSELETYNYDLSSADILTAYQIACTLDANSDGIPDVNETDLWNPPAQDPIINPVANPGDTTLPTIQLLEPINAN